MLAGSVHGLVAAHAQGQQRATSHCARLPGPPAVVLRRLLPKNCVLSTKLSICCSVGP